jgi:transposase InsO family protein
MRHASHWPIRSLLTQKIQHARHSTAEFELRREKHFATRAQARAGVAAWIEDYNTARRHSALGMRSPLAYEHALAAGEAA